MRISSDRAMMPLIKSDLTMRYLAGTNVDFNRTKYYLIEYYTNKEDVTILEKSLTPNTLSTVTEAITLTEIEVDKYMNSIIDFLYTTKISKDQVQELQDLLEFLHHYNDGFKLVDWHDHIHLNDLLQPFTD